MMKKSVFLLGLCILGAQANSSTPAPLQEMLQVKKSKSAWWYTGTVLAGTGALSLVAGSHFDGVAALHRNQAARLLHQSASAEEFYAERQNMQKWLDRRNLAWQIGLGLGALGGSLMLIDLWHQKHVQVQVQPTGLQVQKSF